MKKIYVAHPYNAEQSNKHKVEQIIKSLVKANPNILYISPIHATGFLYHDVNYMQGMKYCFELLKLCDELLICPGWQNSRGCKLEKAYAKKHNIKISYL